MLQNLLFDLPNSTAAPRKVAGRIHKRTPAGTAQPQEIQSELNFPQGNWVEFCNRAKLLGLNLQKLKCEGAYAARAREQISAIEWLSERPESINLISAPTGSGKTLIELITALFDLKVKGHEQPKIALIVTPRINLTYQHALYEAAEVIADKSIPVIAVSSGNKSQRKKDYNLISQKGSGIIVITPETLLKELKREGSLLSACEIASLTLDEAHHLSEGYEAEGFGGSPYAKVIHQVLGKDPLVRLRLFSATHFINRKQGEDLIRFFGEICPARKVAMRILDLPAPELSVKKISITQVADYRRLREVLDSATSILVAELSGKNDTIRAMLEDLVKNPADIKLSKKYFNYVHDRDYEFLRKGALYSAPALIGILRHSVQLLNEPAVCLSLLYALAVFAYQDKSEVVRTFGKNFDARNTFNEESKTYKERINFARKFLKRMFVYQDAPLFKAFAVMALKCFPEDYESERDEPDLHHGNPSVNKLRYLIENKVDSESLLEMEERITKQSFRSSSRVMSLLACLKPGDRELIYYNRVELAEAVAKIINKQAGREMAVPYTSNQSEEQSEGNLAKILSAESGVTKLVMTSKAGEGKNIPKAKRLYVCSVPNTALELVQLYGRVGRDGQPGEVVLLLTAQELKALGRLENEAAKIVPAFRALAAKYH